MSIEKSPGSSELMAALAKCRTGLVGVGLLSAVLNILTLSGSIYMMLVYDLVLPSRSVPTLLGLLMLVALLYLFQGVFDIIRGRMLMQIGAALDHGLTRRVHDLIGRLQVQAPGRADGLQPIRDLDSVRAFIGGGGLPAMLDLPWMILFLGLLFIFHPFLGAAALAGALVMMGLTWAADRLTRAASQTSSAVGAARMTAADTERRHAEVIQALGMRSRMSDRWFDVSRRYLASQERLNNLTGALSGSSKIFRMFLQSAVLTIGAFLVIDNRATGGIIFASSILTARALAPVEVAIANWRGFTSARQGWTRLGQLFTHLPQEAPSLDLPAPVANLSCENLSLGPPGSGRVTVQDVTFKLLAGDAVVIIGPSASGKSSLVRALVGAWLPTRGKVRLDGAALDQWSSEALGPHIGYLPQSVELLEGTIAENISRFNPAAQAPDIIAAARQAGVHEMILRLRDGYETQVGADGDALSAGQRQRVALARALFGNPFFVILDEPNSNLDAEGDAALTVAIESVRARGGVVVLVTHRPSILGPVNLALFMRDGRMIHFGPKDDVLSTILASPISETPHVRVANRHQEARG